jgi:hypothetical protein
VDYYAIVDRVRAEFLEMPGLRLTPAQAMRLWGVDAAMCNRIITQLVGMAFLKWAAGGAVARADE